jgi:hypothetical protein
MYHPYFRGKQYELITIRELAPLLKTAGFRPIIEPVKESLGGLEKALKAVVDAGGRAIVIVNPHHGDLSGAGEPLTKLLKGSFLDLPGISAGILLKQDMTTDEALRCYKAHSAHTPVMIHAGFSEARALSEEFVKPRQDQCHIFFDRFCGKLYQKHFKGAPQSATEGRLSAKAECPQSATEGRFSAKAE